MHAPKIKPNNKQEHVKNSSLPQNMQMMKKKKWKLNEFYSLSDEES